MITATFCLSFSGLSIEISETDFLEQGFVVRFTIFTITFFLLALLFEIVQRNIEKIRGILLANTSGLMFSLSDFWVALLIGSFTLMFSGSFSIGGIFLLIISAIIMPVTNIFGIITIQKSFKNANASHMITIQQVPLNITPVIMYLLVFLLVPPSLISILLLIGGSILIVISSFILSKRQLKIDEVN
jgi:hypothetical protein